MYQLRGILAGTAVALAASACSAQCSFDKVTNVEIEPGPAGDEVGASVAIST